MSYDFFLEMAWKSAAISAAALLIVAVLRTRSAADRGAALRVGMLLLLALPVISVSLPSIVVETPAPAAPPRSAVTASAAPLTLSQSELASSETMATLSAVQAGGDWNDPGPLFLLLYLGGVAMVGGRLLAGLLTLRRWTAEASPVVDPHWQAALDRADMGDRQIRLLVSDEASSPLSWGWLRPAILLDRDALRRPEDADAILAHEVAHIVRNDWPVLMLSRIAVALFWFNPLVWRLDREIAQQAEEAADGYAAERVEPARYAQTLLDWARQSGSFVPANAMAGSEPGLSRRVKALLDGRFRRRSSRFWSLAATLTMIGVAAPVAAVQFVPQAPNAPELPKAPAAPAARFAPAAPAARVAPATRAAPPAPAAVLAPPAPGAPAAPPTAAVPPAPPVKLAALHPHGAAAPHPPEPPRPPRPSHRVHVDAEAIAVQVEAAVAEAHKSAAVVRAHALANIDAKAIERQVRHSVRAGLADGARGLQQGAVGMEQGADSMAREAARLRDRGHREREIARAAARGDTVTHEELLDAAREMAAGAREMREAAREMHREAEEMRRGG
ncbi:MAG TPA: M56 family metallopeptidase [Allosphingosinicella sp.]|nr:M56 family metallopeptidase [Allosphingosinicella sp.]